MNQTTQPLQTRKPTQHPITRAAIACFVLIYGMSLLTTTPASAVSNHYKVWNTLGKGVKIRRGDMSAVPETGPQEGEELDLRCQTTGPMIDGSNIWDYVYWHNFFGWIPDAYIYTGYAAFDPRLPRCGVTPPPPTTTPTPPPPASGPVVAAKWSANLQDQASPGSPVIGTLPAGKAIDMRCYVDAATATRYRTNSNRWYLVGATPFRLGYIHASLIDNPITVRACLGLPYPVGETRTASGSHSWNGATMSNRSSIDFWGGNGVVTAAGDGIIRVTSCGLLMIDHGAGRWTSYYHINIDSNIRNSQSITRGTRLGTIGTNTPCGGKADGPHVHYTLWNIPAGWNMQGAPDNSWGVDLESIDIGGWIEHHSGQRNYWSWFTRTTDGYRQDALVGTAQLGNSGRLA
jgi:hypothetical protein